MDTIMVVLLPVLLSLLAVNRKPTAWYIDGNNLMGHKGTPKERDVVTEKLKPMKDQGLDIFVVFDAQRGEGFETKVSKDGRFSTVIMAEGKSADEFILEEIDRIVGSGESFVRVVTADRDLRQQVLGVRSVVRGVVNPLVFWKRYRPRMTGAKKAKICC